MGDLYIGDLILARYNDDFVNVPEMIVLEENAVFQRNQFGYELVDHGNILSNEVSSETDTTYTEADYDAEFIPEAAIYVDNLRIYHQVSKRGM